MPETSSRRHYVVAQFNDWGGGVEAEHEGLQCLAGYELAQKRFENDEGAVIAAATGADGLILNSGYVTRKVLEALAPKLKVVSRYGVGYERVDTDAATDFGVVVSNVRTGGVFNQEMSNGTILLLLACAKKLIPLDRVARSADWFEGRRPYMRPLVPIYGQVLGLVGLGDIGLMVADKARAFDLEVIAYDPYAKPEVAKEHGVELTDMDDILRRSDFVSIHCPLTPETQGLIGEREFRLMKPSAYVINTARGAIINEQAMLAALQEGRIAGAGLDVLEQEPPSLANPLLKMANVVFTPHCAGISDRATYNIKRKAAENVARVLSGRWPDAVINPGIRQKLEMKG